MKYSAIAALLSTASAGTKYEGFACTKVDDCVDTLSCSDVGVGSGTAAAVPITTMCVTTASCTSLAELSGSDGKKYLPTAYKCYGNLEKDTAVISMWPAYKILNGVPNLTEVNKDIVLQSSLSEFTKGKTES